MSEPKPAAEPIDWNRVTAQIAAGDMAAFAVYYERFFDLMFSDACRLLNADENSALDVVQDAMLKAVRSMKPKRDEPELTAWSRVVVRCVAYDWLRKGRREKKYPVLATDTYELIESRDSDAVDFEARRIWLEEQLQTLPSDLRQLVDLRYRLGWTLTRIGNRFGLKPGAVDGRIRRLISQLRENAETRKQSAD